MAAVFLFVMALSVLSGGKAHAASITVNTDTHPSLCTLDKAIENINDQADTNNDCVEIGVYGNNDTINIPEGTVLLTADLPSVTKAVSIVGQGIGHTVIDAASQWNGFGSQLTAGNFAISGLTMRNIHTYGMILRDAESTIVSQVEIDGAGLGGMSQGIAVDNDTPYPAEVTVSDVYVHDFNLNESFITAFGISTSGRSSTTTHVSRVTVANITNTGGINPFLFGLGSGTSLNGSGNIVGDATNITVTGITSTAMFTFGIATVNMGSSVAVPSLDLRNSTVTNVSNPSGLPTNLALVGVAGVGINQEDTAQSHVKMTNVIMSGSSGSTTSCGIMDIGPLVGGSGLGTGTISSGGGNLSEDNSCETHLTESTDQNNLTNLGSTLGSLSDNGGYIPTIPLLQGSPAIDSGVDVSGLTTDARLAVRPQGTAFDSGAYESPFTKPAPATLASTGENNAYYALVASAIVAISTGALVVNRRQYQ